MSGVAIVRALLAQSAAVTALVPTARIFTGIVPQGAAMPAISVRTVSQSEQETVARNYPLKMLRERVQVTVLAKSDDASASVQLKNILRATALGPGVHTGTVAGFAVRSVMPWGVGPELPPGDDKIFEQSRDFMVTFVEAN